MKTCAVLSCLSLIVFPIVAGAWQANQAADLILGAYPTLGRIQVVSDLALEAATGKLYVVDSESGRVLRYSSQNKLVTGSPPEAIFGKPDIEAAASTTLSASNLVKPSGLTVDANGRLWVADQNRILRWDNAAGRISGSAADGVLGGSDFTSVYGSVDARRLGATMRLVTDPAGNLFVSCYDRNVVLRFDAAGTKPNGAAADAYFGQLSFTNTSGALSQTRVFGPRDLLMRGTTLWIHDGLNRRVLKLNNAATRSSGASFDAVLGQSTYFTNNSIALEGCTAVDISPSGTMSAARPGDFGPAIASWSGIEAKPNFDLLAQPVVTAGGSLLQMFSALTYESDNRLWVGASESTQFLAGPPVRRLDALPSLVASSTLGAAPVSPLGRSWQVAVDPVSSKVFVSDPDSHVIRRFASMNALGSHALPELIMPNVWAMGMCFDKEGRLWVAEGVKSRVLRWDNPSALTTAAPPDGIIGHTYPSGPPATANEASIFFPYSVTVDAAGSLWVLDFQLQRILRFDQAALRSGDIPADGMLGKSSFTDTSTSGLPGRFYRATRAQIDHSGNLWVMDTSGVDEIAGGNGDQIRLFKYNNPSAKLPGDMPDVTIRFSNAATGAHSFVVTPDNSLWVAFGVGGFQIHRFANLQAPAVSYVGAGPPGMGPTSFGGLMNALSTDTEGHLWVTDPVNNRVMRFKDGADAAPGALGIAATSLKTQGLEIAFNAVPLRYYVVESSADLQNWTGRLFMQASTALETYTAESDSLGRRAFYRVREQP